MRRRCLWGVEAASGRQSTVGGFWVLGLAAPPEPVQLEPAQWWRRDRTETSWRRAPVQPPLYQQPRWRLWQSLAPQREL
ncbi:hypothetical protein PBY51_016531 [Eleginops maclovinus]|uniref:Uncharacterized protein n=1 Tax=Eleginops maclovinus TaxID=56733 RepID=A0AAN7WPM9_ELEMC|nr:hypothetical protein PBY51_016531 [Eleginops maclovinus]